MNDWVTVEMAKCSSCGWESTEGSRVLESATLEFRPGYYRFPYKMPKDVLRKMAVNARCRNCGEQGTMMAAIARGES